jgi:TnpA family transposase
LTLACAAGLAAEPALEKVLRRDVNLDLIHREYDNALHLAASIAEGYTSATYILERYGAAARGSPAYEGLRHQIRSPAPVNSSMSVSSKASVTAVLIVRLRYRTGSLLPLKI